MTIYGKACPLFVPLVEEGLWVDPVTDEIAKRYLAELIDLDIDTLILGCTHYPLIRSTLGRIMGEKVSLVNPAYETARELKELLGRKDCWATMLRSWEKTSISFMSVTLRRNSRILPIPSSSMGYCQPRPYILRSTRALERS